jgi:hypothetical protein
MQRYKLKCVKDGMLHTATSAADSKDRRGAIEGGACSPGTDIDAECAAAGMELHLHD